MNLGLYIAFFIIIFTNVQMTKLQLKMVCFFPPLALQLGCLTFVSGYDENSAIKRSEVFGMLVNIFIY
jgi:hypothetical protein